MKTPDSVKLLIEERVVYHQRRLDGMRDDLNCLNEKAEQLRRKIYAEEALMAELTAWMEGANS